MTPLSRRSFRIALPALLAATLLAPSAAFADAPTVTAAKGLFGLYDAKEERFVVEPSFGYVWDYGGGKAKVRLEDGTIRYIDATGKLLPD